MKLVIISLAAALLLLNCKKSRITPDADVRTAVVKQPATVLADNGDSFHLLYDENGQLLVHTAADAVHYYKPGNDHFLTRLLKESNEKISYRNAQRDAHNRIIELEQFKQDIPESLIEFTYNSSGYLSKRKVVTKNIVQEFIYHYDEGNLVKIEEYSNGVLSSTVLFEYYNDRFNTLGIDLFDLKQIGFVTDAQFGKQSEKLIKSINLVSQDDPKGIGFYYYYKTDAHGLIRSMEIKTNNATLKNYNFIFQ